MRLAYDIETNGLLEDVTKAHCIVAIDVDTEKVYKFRPHQIAEGVKLLEQADELIGHNIIKYDDPVLRKLVNFFPRGFQHDTLVYARLIWSNIKDKDAGLIKRWRNSNGQSGMPPRLFGSQSLKAWGYRLKEFKGDYGEQEEAWDKFSEEMLDYCVQDVRVTVKLWKLIESKGYDPRALQLETDAAWLLAKMERNGFHFDRSKAVELYSTLSARRNELKAELIETFGSWYEAGKVNTPKRTITYKDPLKASRVEGAAFTPVKHITFNPASRQHVGRVLRSVGWRPEEKTDSGQDKVDESILNKLTHIPEAALIAEYFMLQKRLGQLAEGNQAWLRVLRKDGCIHGSINPNGAVTGRATHAFPNVAQVPSCGAPYGRECRELFTVPTGWCLLGTDMSGLELRCLGHFMARWDEGAYIKEILEGDIHTANQHAAGLDERSQAKTFIYAFLYGAGDELIGAIVDPTAPPEEQARIGRALKRKFLKNTPALRKLRDAVKKAAARGYLHGLDGRQVFVRSEHSALNTLLQSAGALVCKKWIIEFDRIAKERGFKHGWDGDYALCAWVHDEMQVACRTPEIAQQLGEISQEVARLVGEHFNFNCPLDSDFSVGPNWAATH